MSTKPQETPQVQIDRRALLIGSGTVIAAAAGSIGYQLIRRFRGVRTQTPVFLARNQTYDGPLEQTIRDGLLSVGLDPAELKGRRVLLKPNMVEPIRSSPQMTTHPAVIVATANVFRNWGATVSVGEAPGHVRDTEMALSESRIGEALDDAKLPFADLNYEEVGFVANRPKVSQLRGLFFPSSVLQADLIVSMPKLKTHHWVGITAALKNLYGTLPGVVYGWPKNVLHHAGIPQTVIDINGSLPPSVAVVDAITCMEGDGPILGTAKSMGMIAVGANLTALDATLARIIGLVPQRVSYLSLAHGRLGTVSEAQIEQRGEPWRPLHSPFSIISTKDLDVLRARSPGELES